MEFNKFQTVIARRNAFNRLRIITTWAPVTVGKGLLDCSGFGYHHVIEDSSHLMYIKIENSRRFFLRWARHAKKKKELLNVPLSWEVLIKNLRYMGCYSVCFAASIAFVLSYGIIRNIALPNYTSFLFRCLFTAKNQLGFGKCFITIF